MDIPPDIARPDETIPAMGSENIGAPAPQSQDVIPADIARPAPIMVSDTRSVNSIPVDQTLSMDGHLANQAKQHVAAFEQDKSSMPIGDVIKSMLLANGDNTFLEANSPTEYWNAIKKLVPSNSFYGDIAGRLTSAAALMGMGDTEGAKSAAKGAAEKAFPITSSIAESLEHTAEKKSKAPSSVLDTLWNDVIPGQTISGAVSEIPKLAPIATGAAEMAGQASLAGMGPFGEFFNYLPRDQQLQARAAMGALQAETLHYANKFSNYLQGVTGGDPEDINNKAAAFVTDQAPYLLAPELGIEGAAAKAGVGVARLDALAGMAAKEVPYGSIAKTTVKTAVSKTPVVGQLATWAQKLLLKQSPAEAIQVPKLDVWKTIKDAAGSNAPVADAIIKNLDDAATKAGEKGALARQNLNATDSQMIDAKYNDGSPMYGPKELSSEAAKVRELEDAAESLRERTDVAARARDYSAFQQSLGAHTYAKIFETGGYAGLGGLVASTESPPNDKSAAITGAALFGGLHAAHVLANTPRSLDELRAGIDYDALKQEGDAIRTGDPDEQLHNDTLAAMSPEFQKQFNAAAGVNSLVSGGYKSLFLPAEQFKSRSGGLGGQGVADPTTKTILYNADQPDVNTIFHEGGHGVFPRDSGLFSPLNAYGQTLDALLKDPAARTAIRKGWSNYVDAYNIGKAPEKQLSKSIDYNANKVKSELTAMTAERVLGDKGGFQRIYRGDSLRQKLIDAFSGPDTSNLDFNFPYFDKLSKELGAQFYRSGEVARAQRAQNLVERSLTAAPEVTTPYVPDPDVIAEAKLAFKKLGVKGDVGAAAAAINARGEPVTPEAVVKEALKPQASEEKPAQIHKDQGIDAVIRDYTQKADLDYTPHEDYAPIDEAKSMATSDAYEKQTHDPNNPAVQKSYDAFRDAIMGQYNTLLDHGYKIEPWTGEGQPYADSPAMLKDLRENKHLYYFPTEEGHGLPGGSTPPDHPQLRGSGVFFNGKEALVNDIFRGVHDALGHGHMGFPFGPRGEYNAFLAHRSTLPPESHGALATETIGQNSFTNFGPHMRNAEGNLIKPGEPGYLKIPERPWTQQRANLLDFKPEPITASEARGNSRPVSQEEFDSLAKKGESMLAKRKQNQSPPRGLEGWDHLKEKAFNEVQRPWGGVTINSHTGVVMSPRSGFAISVKEPGQETISIPDNSSRAELDAAMEKSKSYYHQLANEGYNLGVFHDDANRSIDIDPILIVKTPHEVEAIGAHTRAIGGAYDFSTGNGYFPPHVPVKEMGRPAYNYNISSYKQGQRDWRSRDYKPERATEADKTGAIEEGEPPWSIRLRRLEQKSLDSGKMTPAEEEAQTELHKRAAKEYGSYSNWFDKFGQKPYLQDTGIGPAADRVMDFKPSDHPDAIKSAAVRDERGNISPGKYHIDAENIAIAKNSNVKSLQHGYVTNSGDFIDKEDALAHALKIRQTTLDNYKAAEAKRTGIDEEELPDQLPMDSIAFAHARDFKPSHLKSDAELHQEGEVNYNKANPDAVPFSYMRNKDGTIRRLPNGTPMPKEEGFDIMGTPKALKATEGVERADAKKAAVTNVLRQNLTRIYDKVKNVPEISQAKGWYKEVRAQLRPLFDSDADTWTFAQALGVTSAGQKVRANLEQAIDLYNGIKTGRFVDLASRAQQLLDAGKLQYSDKFLRDNNILPVMESGVQYGKNSRHALRVILNTWGESAPLKTGDYASNFATGRTAKAVIDMWAVRTARRALGGQRLTPKGQAGVSDVEYKIIQNAMHEAADRAGIAPDDMQAILWFAEKKFWDDHGYGTESGGDIRPLLPAVSKGPLSTLSYNKQAIPYKHLYKYEQRAIDKAAKKP